MDREKLIGSQVMNLIPKADQKAARSRFKEMADVKITVFDSTSQKRDGTIVPVALRVS